MGSSDIVSYVRASVARRSVERHTLHASRTDAHPAGEREPLREQIPVEDVLDAILEYRATRSSRGSRSSTSNPILLKPPRRTPSPNPTPLGPGGFVSKLATIRERNESDVSTHEL